MRYPAILKKGDIIGVTAPSSGVSGVSQKKLDNAALQLGQLGYKCIESQSVRNQFKQVSASSKQRADEFMHMYLDDSINAIIPPWGGEFLMDMLPYLDYDALKKAPPKWIMGFSDISTLLFVLTTKCDFATAHGPNFMDFGNKPIDSSVLRALDMLESENGLEQKSLELYQKTWPTPVEGCYTLPYNLTEKVEWKLLDESGHCDFNGRLIGGCMDIICKLIGTSFDEVNGYVDRYSEDGFIWFLESCEMNSAEIYRTLWQMKMNGWFRHCNGIIYGRPEGYSDLGDFNFKDALKCSFEDLNVPVIYGADLGHMPPQLTFINGAKAEFEYKDGIGRINQKFA